MAEKIKHMHWYFNRLRCMSIYEIAYRIKQRLKLILEFYGYYVVKKVKKPNYSCMGQIWIKDVDISDPVSYIESANNILKCEFPIFSMNKVKIGAAIGWNCDPLTKRMAPLKFGLRLNYKDEDLVGDIKYLWEPNRHIHLVILAQAYYLSNEDIYLQEIKKQIISWIDECPYLMGPNWSSSLELAIRLINWSIIWQLIGGVDSSIFRDAEGNKFLERWMTSIFQHMHFIMHHLSRNSSANNHLIGEAAGVFIAITMWPLWNESQDWRDESKNILIQEIILQNYSDGVNKEQAISYQQFVIDFFLFAASTGKENHIEFPSECWNRIESMLEYVASIMDVNGNIAMIGDADDGYVTKLSRESKFCPFRSLLATGAILFHRGDFKKKAGYLDDKTCWLLGKQVEKFHSIEMDNSVLPIHRSFPDGGYYILGADFEKEKEIRLIVDAGPLGYQSIAAHGHADALAIILSIAGHELLVDPGTYAYHTKKKWREYFRGTSAHNTVMIDGENQSIIGGNFMWLKKANAECLMCEMDDICDKFIGQHDGYTRLKDPVIHRREIYLYKKIRKIEISDSFDCRGKHLIKRFWHFSEECKVVQSGFNINASINNVVMNMNITNKNTIVSTHYGQDDPPLGWISRKYDVKLPTTTIVESTKIIGSSFLRNEIYY